MKTSDDNSPQLVRIGESILDQAIENSSDFSDHSQTKPKNGVKDKIYLHTVQLSNLLKSLKINDVKSVSLKSNEVNQIKQQIDIIFNDLQSAGKSVSIDVGPGSSAYEALRIISFALMAISNNINSNNYSPPANNNSNLTLSEPNFRSGSNVIEDNSIRLENVQLKNKLISFQEQFETEKNIKNELMNQNAQLNSAKIDLVRKTNELTEKLNDLTERNKNLQEKLEMLNYEREAQYDIDSTQIQKLREKSVNDSRKIRELQAKNDISPDEVQNSYIASLLGAEMDGVKELMRYLEGEFQLEESLLPRTLLPQLKIAIEDRKAHPILNENVFLNQPLSNNECNEIVLNTQIESYKAQIEDLKNQLELSKSNNCFNSNLIEKGKIEEENNMRDLLIQNYNLETQISSLKSENSRLSAELHATNQYFKSQQQNAQKEQIEEVQQPMNSNDENSIYLLESEIKANKVKLNELTDLSNKRKNKISVLNQNLQSAQDELKSKDSIIENLRMQIDKLTLERDDLAENSQQNNSGELMDPNQLNSELKLKEAENKKLNQALSDLYKEMEALTSELEIEGKEKNSIFLLLQKHSQALTESETQLKSFQNQLKKKDDEISLFKQNNEKLKLQISKKNVCNHREVVENIQKFFLNSNNNNDFPKEYQAQIMNILNSSTDAVPLILELLDYFQQIIANSSSSLIQSSEEELKKLQEQNNRLFIYISNILVFIDQLANSGELQKWIIGTDYEVDYRSQLLAQYSRIETFIKQHCKTPNNEAATLSEENQCKEFITDFPTFVDKITNGKLDNEIEREHVLIMQLCFSSNDLLRKFADRILVQNETLQTDINHIRRELMQTGNETDEKIAEATKDTEEELESERSKRYRAEEILNKIAKKLRGSKTSTPDVLNSVQQCLNLIDDDNLNNDNDENYVHQSNHSHKDIQRELQKLEKEKEQAYKANQMLAQKAKEKIKKLKNVISSQSSQIEEYNTIKDKLANAQKENESLQQYLNQSQAENDKNEKALKEIQRQMKENEQLKDSTFLKFKEESELQISSLQEELDDWKRKSECTDVSTQEEVKRVKHEAKLKIKKMQNELLLQIQRNDETRSHFEPIVNDLREKLNISRANEKQLQEETKNFDIERKQLKSDLATATIDLKMAKMKLKAAEEKVVRDKNLIESQYRMKIADIQSKNCSLLEDQKNTFDSNFHSFLVSICQKFKDFVDFNEMITEESVKKTLDKIVGKMNENNKELKSSQERNAELSKLKSLLGIQDDESVLPVISVISKDASEFNSIKAELESKKAELENLLKVANDKKGFDKVDEEWESWARRVYTLISDYSSNAQTAKELQFALEEALLGNIGQRLTTRRLGTLRTEKKILLTGMVNKFINNNNAFDFEKKSGRSLLGSKNKESKSIEKSKLLSIRHILIVLSCIKRMQKISGHIKCSIISPKRKLERNEKEIIGSNFKNDKGYPILNSNE